jgi:hypothetical protein
MTSRIALLMALAGLACPAQLLAGAAQHGRVFQERHYVAVIQPAGAEIDRIGVKLPINAKIPKVEVFADTRDMGDKTGAWKKCDIESKACEIGDVRIIRFNRVEHRDTDSPWQELSVDVASDATGASRTVKLLVTFQPQGGRDLEECRLETDCGWHERVASPL